ncbi:MAG: cyclomaltodextrinase C-terminal domain-containing protein, partial [Flavobacteriales bacterium]|nr:cyclomaltodextrinase C-terminal domain-containing protein [Flavobacteriales bacterium]
QFRSQYPEIFNGDMIHFVPEGDTYVYFRRSESEQIMVLINVGDESKTIKTSRFKECLTNYEGTDIIAKAKRTLLEEEELPPNSIQIIHLQR